MEISPTAAVVPGLPVDGAPPLHPVATLLTWLHPRDVRLAGRTVSVLCAVGLAITVLTLPMGVNDGSQINGTAMVLAGAALALAAVICWAARFFDDSSRLAWAVCPFAAVTVIVLVDLATHDASVSAQVFFIFPTVYGAALLPRPGAVLVTLASLAGVLVVVFTQLSFRESAVSACYVVAALGTTAWMLIRSMERQQELVVELARLATVDPLTGLATRRSFDEALASTLADREAEEGTSLVIFDVDEFKSVNDRYGHPAGDQVLVQISELLKQVSRRGDVVCRMGGDEIAMLLPRCTMEVALRRAEEIVELVRGSGFAVSLNDLIRVSLSAGLAHARQGMDTKTLYAAADAALYDAKRGGRDRVVAGASVG